MFKRPMHLFFIVFFVLFTHQAWSSIGSIVLATGKVDIQRANQMIEAQTGSALEAQDKIFTRSGARAQLRFNDDTVITLGSNTEFGIDSFLNEGSNKAEAKFNIAKGTFKAITGKVGKAAPQNFTVKTRTATIGVRGTIFRGRITPTREMIATLSGLIFVMEDQTGQLVEVPAGQFTNVFPGQPPVPPMPLTNQQLEELNEGQGEGENSAGEGGENQDSGNNESNDELTNNFSGGGDNSGANNGSQNIDTNIVDDALNTQIERSVEDTLPNEETELSLVGWKFLSYSSGDFCIECQAPQGQGGDEPIYDDYTFAWGEAFNVKASDMIGSFDSNVGWGTWEQDGLSGYWVGGTQTNDAATHIDSLISQNVVYEYSGKVMGNVYDVNGVHSINSASSSVNLTFLFSDLAIEGQINFSADNGSNWSLNLDQMQSDQYLSGNGFSSAMTGTANSSSVDYGGADGMFYGSNADSIGGYFDAESMAEGMFAEGVFKAVKQ